MQSSSNEREEKRIEGERGAAVRPTATQDPDDNGGFLSWTRPTHASLKMLIHEGFQQSPLTLPPAWDDDGVLTALLRRVLPASVYDELDVELKGFQERLAGRKLTF